MPQFPHEEVAFESGINVRFAIYNSNNDYIPEHWHRSMEVISMRVPWNSLRDSGFCCCMPEIIMW
jgi:hypothetical protein